MSTNACLLSPTGQDYEEVELGLPAGTHTVRIVEGTVNRSKFPDDKLTELNNNVEFKPFQLQLVLEVESSETCDAGRRGTMWVALQGFGSWNLWNLLRMCGMQDFEDLFHAKSPTYRGDTERPIFTEVETAWQRIGAGILNGAIVDENGTEFRTESGHGVLGQRIEIEAREGKKGNIKIYPKRVKV